MKPALLVLGYALVVAWCLPALLTRLTAAGLSARLGLAAWLAAMVSVLASLLAAIQYLFTAAVAGWPQLAEAVCRSVAGGACTTVVYRSAAFELGLGLAAVTAALALAVLAWRYGRSVQRAQRRTRAHAEAARITGRRLPGAGAAVVLNAAQPAAYCVPGRPAAIVLTSAALAVLDPGQLDAVLAHERAHLAGRHHLLIALTRALAATFPGVPLFTRAPAEVARTAVPVPMASSAAISVGRLLRRAAASSAHISAIRATSAGARVNSGTPGKVAASARVSAISR